MSMNDQFETVKRLECMIAFQNNCLREGNWEDFDLAENEVKRLEEKIVSNALNCPQGVSN